MLQTGQQDESDEVRFHSPRPARSYICRRAGTALTLNGLVYKMYLSIPVPTVSARQVDGKEHNVFQLRHLHHKLPGKATFLFHPLQ
jgi:hypothetical protein